MGYVSPKAGLFSSFSTPKSSSYESSKVSAPPVSQKTQTSMSTAVEHKTVSRNFANDISQKSATTSLNNFRDLLTSYLEICEQIEQAATTLEHLQANKKIIEEKIASNPEYEKFASLFNSMKGPNK